MKDTPPLDGIRVLDLTRHLPGPLATLMLADLGAEVIKVEDPRGGDPMRLVPPLRGGLGQAFLMLNRDKQSLALDLKQERGREVFLRLAEQSDVVVEGFRPGVMERLGIGYRQLQPRNPRLVLCSITGYGQTGPLSSRPGHDINYQARSGVLGCCGPRGGPPQLPGVQLADVCGGSWQALAGILGALLARQRSGRGQWLDISMTEGALPTTLLALQEVWAGQPFAGRGHGALSGQGLAGYGVFETADGKYLAVGALEPQFFAELCRVLGLEHLAAEGWLAQGERADQVRAELARAFRQHDRDEWLRRFEGRDACVEPVWEGREVLDDEQLRARDAWFTHRHPRAGQVTGPATPLRLAGSSRRGQPAPRLGQHSRNLLLRLGFPAGIVDDLIEQGVIVD